MKYTKLFNKHDEYVVYTASTEFIIPNVSYCIQEDESHCTPPHFCQEVHIYELMGEPSYPSSVPASATSFDLSFGYTDTYTSITCDQGEIMDGDTVTIPIEENPSMSARTISGTYVFHDINIPYSFTQEGREELPYNQQYLTFEILTGGTILWKAATTAVTRTISYSVNYGEWTEITSTTDGVSFNVNASDKVRFKGNNTGYGTTKDVVSTFSGSTAAFDAYGNAMSLIGGDNFSGLTSFTTDWAFHDLLNTTNVVSAKNLILPVTTLTQCCYRAMFAHSKQLVEAPELPATTLASSGYCYMFQDCTALQKAPDLLAENIVSGCYIGMFNSASTLNYIKCTATSGVTTGNTKDWTKIVSRTGTFIRAANVNWTRNEHGVPTTWELYNDTSVEAPVISFNGFETITLSCETEGADILYKLNNIGEYSSYTTPIIISEDTFIETYATYSGETSIPISKTCQYVSTVPIEYSNRDLKKWQYGVQEITTPYSINAIDGHSSNYAKGTFTFETNFALKEAEPTYLWFQHADQSASIYVDDTLVEKHWGGYAAFTSDISEYVHGGINNIKVAIRNNEGNNLAPASADFNFNATLGNVRLLTSPYVPAMEYGYDGFHITSTVSDAEATVNIKTSVPTGATLVCKIDDGNTNIYSATSASTGDEMTFTKVIANPHLWNGKSDPYLYTVTLEIYKDNEIYHRFVRPYGLRYYEYVINDTEKVGTVSEPYTGFLLNGSPYLLRGCCMHDDIDGKANALDETDYDNTFATIQELGLNFLRLAHYPHPKEVYDRCDRLGIVVQTEGPCVNKLQSTMPTDYYTHLTGQYTDMVNQHYNHPCIFFWGLSNETQTDDKNFGKQKVEEYTALIKSLDSERMVGYVLAQGTGSSPSAYYNDPSNVDWFGCNIYVGWYDSPNSNTPTGQINTRLANTVGRVGKPMAYSEYGCGGTPTCHSDDFMTTTTRGNNPRHDIEYMMWLHEGHIATIKQYPQLLYTSQWQLFDIAVSTRNEGYTVCLDGVNTSTNDALRRLNNKGLVERDHVTKKDPFYLYKAWWNTSDKFVHICQKNYTRRMVRVIKCYTNDGDTLTMYVNGEFAETVSVTNNIALFSVRNFENGDVIKVSGSTASDEFTMPVSPLIDVFLTVKYDVTDTVNPTKIGGDNYMLSFAEIEIDGVKQQNVVSSYTFSTTGEHTIEYRLDDQTLNSYALNGCPNITSIAISDNVKIISDSCFKDCVNLANLYIGSGVESISLNAIEGCDAIENIVVSESNSKYDSRNDCNAIIETSSNKLIRGCNNSTIPDSVTSIGASAFTSCNGLASIDIPNSVTSIGNDVFKNCTNLTTCTIGNGIKTIPQGAFYNCTSISSVTIPSGVTSIGQSAFIGCSSLTSIDIPSGVTSIGGTAFQDCSSLTSIDIPNGVKIIEGYAFHSCTSLTSCTIGSGVTELKIGAFEGCSSLTSIDIPDSVTSLGELAFRYCRSLTSCTIGNCVTSIGYGAFQSCSSLTSIDIPNSVISIGDGVFYQCSGLTSVTIGNSVTKINNNAFSGCYSLTSCAIGSSVTSIGQFAFGGCNSLTSVTIPDSVTNIGQNAFNSCISLTSVTVGNSVKTIGGSAFRNCSNLASITSNATTAPTIQSNTLQNVKTGGTLTVPIGSSGYDTWMQNANFYLGLYNWTKVEQ